MVFADGLREALGQGDVFGDVEFFAPRKSGYHPTLHAPGIVTSHSCDFTKFSAAQAKGRDLDRFPLLVAPLVTGSQIGDRGTAGNARADRVARYFYIGDEDPLGEGHFADYWFMQPVGVVELLASNRIASMTDHWQRRLQRSLDRFFSWEDRKKTLDD